jgi:hypothetical protein
MMRYFKISSVFLLIVFSINLISEISHSFSGTNDSHSLETSSSDYKEDFDGHQDNHSNQASSEHADCQDPCHLGICHLGHCGMVPLMDFDGISFFTSKINQVSINFNFFSKDSPFLEGLRRPPRFS